jgi:hypothetical protein
MILTLLLVNIGDAEWVERTLSRLPGKSRRLLTRFLRLLRAPAPASLGVPFDNQ